MALWQLLTLAVAAATISLIAADGYRSGGGPTAVVHGPYAPSYAPYEDYPSYDRDYSFNYGIKDDNTYNYQTRDEVKKGNTVYGSYSVVEPDGNLRIVKYEADDYGFRATVDREGVPADSPAYVAAGPPPPTPVYKGPVAESYSAPYVPAPAPAYRRPYLSVHKPDSYAPPPPPPVHYGPRPNYVRPVLYKAPVPPPTVYSRANYKAPVYNYDDEN